MLQHHPFSILVNGKSYSMIHPSRGIHQGDPISPYLFLLFVEGHTALLKKAESKGRIKGVSICRGAPKVTNLMFANDSLLFCQATRAEGETLGKVLIWKSLQLTLVVILLKSKKARFWRFWE